MRTQCQERDHYKHRDEKEDLGQPIKLLKKRKGNRTASPCADDSGHRSTYMVWWLTRMADSTLQACGCPSLYESTEATVHTLCHRIVHSLFFFSLSLCSFLLCSVFSSLYSHATTVLCWATKDEPAKGKGYTCERARGGCSGERRSGSLSLSLFLKLPVARLFRG